METQEATVRPLYTAATLSYLGGFGLMLLSFRQRTYYTRLVSLVMLTGGLVTPATLVYRYHWPFKEDTSLYLSRVGGLCTVLSWVMLALT